MEKLDNDQKKKILYSVLYAGIVALLIVAAALTVIVLNKQDVKVQKTPSLNVGNNQEIVVSTPSYVVPLKDATGIKDYSAKELQYKESLKQWEIHKAIDFLAGSSLDVLAFTDGTVSKVYSNYLEGTVISKDSELSQLIELGHTVNIEKSKKIQISKYNGTISANYIK